MLLGHHAQLVVGAGLPVAVVELDLEGQGFLVVVLRLLPAPLLLGHRAQLAVSHGAGGNGLRLDRVGEGHAQPILEIPLQASLVRLGKGIADGDGVSPGMLEAQFGVGAIAQTGAFTNA